MIISISVKSDFHIWTKGTFHSTLCIVVIPRIRRSMELAYISDKSDKSSPLRRYVMIHCNAWMAPWCNAILVTNFDELCYRCGWFLHWNMQLMWFFFIKFHIILTHFMHLSNASEVLLNIQSIIYSSTSFVYVCVCGWIIETWLCV